MLCKNITLWKCVSVHRWFSLCYMRFCSAVWCGAVWCGVVQCGVVQCGLVWCSVVWSGVCVNRPYPTLIVRQQYYKHWQIACILCKHFGGTKMLAIWVEPEKCFSCRVYRFLLPLNPSMGFRATSLTLRVKGCWLLLLFLGCPYFSLKPFLDDDDCP